MVTSIFTGVVNVPVILQISLNIIENADSASSSVISFIEELNALLIVFKSPYNL